jgi:uncharacterized protein YpiB (UPF0302 family)
MNNKKKSKSNKHSDDDSTGALEGSLTENDLEMLFKQIDRKLQDDESFSTTTIPCNYGIMIL